MHMVLVHQKKKKKSKQTLCASVLFRHPAMSISRGSLTPFGRYVERSSNMRFSLQDSSL